MLDHIITTWLSPATLEIVSVVFGLVYVILAARENSWCWPAALVGTGTAIFLFWDASLIMESALNVYYLAMAVFGWWQWQYGTLRHKTQPASKLVIQSWRFDQHMMAFGLVAVLTSISGYILSQNTEAAWPYVDSFTTWSAVICTWMVTRKILENWLYWIVIDLVSIVLYYERELYFYAGLFVVYCIIAVFGYRLWRKKLIDFTHNKT